MRAPPVLHQSKGCSQMMGAIVLSMLLCWFALVAALTIWSRNHEELAEDSARTTGSTTGAPNRASDDS